jgi:methylmalonyl-CoA/ethylmalonyl-CoA epimerase
MNSEPLEGVHAPEHLKLHHIGFVVFSIQESVEGFARSVDATWDGNVVFDAIQKVRVTFFKGHNPTDPLIELVEPSGPASPVASFVERGGGLHHLCYEVPNLEAHLTFCKSVGAKIICPPVPAVAFGGRRIAWAVTRNRLLMEFLER